MTLTFNNGYTLEVKQMFQQRVELRSFTRPAMAFVVDAVISLDQLKELFTEVNCSTLTIVNDDETTQILEGYKDRASITTQWRENIDGSYNEEVVIIMAQPNDQEWEMRKMQQQIAQLEARQAELEAGQAELEATNAKLEANQADPETKEKAAAYDIIVGDMA